MKYYYLSLTVMKVNWDLNSMNDNPFIKNIKV